MTDLAWAGALDLSARIAAGDLAPSELMAATLARVAAVNPGVNAIVSLRDGDVLMAEARAADDGPRRGWLHGIPIAIKDLADAAGLPTTMGAPVLAAMGPVAADEVMVARLRAAGAIVIGKTNTPEWGLGSQTFNPLFGATLNPWDRGRTPGGSSGGAAVALATGMLAVADGSDMMGSLRNPAGWTGTYGMRPSWGLVPSEPRGDTFLHQLSTLGPMARNPADLAALLATQSGPDPRQPHGLPAFVPPGPRDLAGLRVGWLGDWGGAWAFEAGVQETCAAALGVFGDLGMTVEAVAPPFPAEALWESWVTLRSWAVAAGLGVFHANPVQRAALKPEAIWEIERGQALGAMAVHRASVIRSQWFAAAAALFDRYDALVLPSAQVWPFAVDQRWPEVIAGRQMDTYHRWMEVVLPVSLAGLPCVCVPGGFGPQGLPIGLQVFGRRGADAGLIQIAMGWHQAAPWAGRRPPA
jgi:amidase